MNAMNAYSELEIQIYSFLISALYAMIGQLQVVPSYSRKKNLGTRLTGNWVDSTAGLDLMERTKFCL
jgi:hypothetical protein